MAHISNVDPQTLPADLKDVFDRFTTGYGPFANQAAVLAHVPEALRHLPEMLMALKAAGAVPQRYIELAIVVVSRLNECTYCVNHHKPKLQVEGISEAAVDLIMTPDAHPDFTDADKAVIAWAQKVEGDFHRVVPADIAGLKAHFTESQIVELTLRASLCGFFNRFNDALGIEDETLGQHTGATAAE
ncbi:MAG: carboxymuconolactone decarboxylase family protein [Alphaproteobacteria bacterium]|nr:carboxymuconolactone decarboxylase family protein [Alphaproteobacteria bacterium]